MIFVSKCKCKKTNLVRGRAGSVRFSLQMSIVENMQCKNQSDDSKERTFATAGEGEELDLP